MMNLSELLEIRGLIDAAVGALERIEQWRRGAGVEEEIEPAAAEPEQAAPESAAAEPEVGRCATCGTEFAARQRGGQPKRYCSPGCRKAAHTASARARRQERASAPADDAELAGQDDKPEPAGARPARSSWQPGYNERILVGDDVPLAQLLEPPAIVPGEAMSPHAPSWVR